MREERLKAVLIFAGSVFLAVFCITPFLFMLAVSLSGEPDFLSPRTAWRASLEHYRDIFTNPDLHFWSYLRNSLLVSLLSAAGAVFAASLAAYAIARLPLAGKGPILFSVLAVSMFPQISLAGYLFKLTAQLGWVNTLHALVLPYTAWILPLALWILVSYFSKIPPELDRAAYVDGCSHWQILWKVIFPLALPGILSTALLCFIAAFNEFMFALILTTDHHARTLPVGIALFQGLHGQVPWGSVMAASAVTILPIIALTIFFQRRIVQGLTQGGRKRVTVELTVRKVKKRFVSLRGTHEALKGIDLHVRDKEFFVLLGPSGCGKSTLLHLIAGLERPTEGEIGFDGWPVASAGVFQTPRERNVAMVFQSYALYPHLNVFENIAFGLRIQKMKEEEIKASVHSVSETLRIGHLLAARPRELSGGERQRVAIARAVVRKPQVFLLDEPLSNLDAQLRMSMREELKALQRRLAITTIYVTHDQVEAMTLGDRIAVLREGELEQIGTPAELYRRPGTPFVARFIGSPP